ncbi:hypothetical protein BA893_01730 [Vibrio natriegens]|nr:hypothetical protein BA893_01730 [Vibrio natriegens]
MLQSEKISNQSKASEKESQNDSHFIVHSGFWGKEPDCISQLSRAKNLSRKRGKIGPSTAQEHQLLFK